MSPSPRRRRLGLAISAALLGGTLVAVGATGASADDAPSLQPPAAIDGASGSPWGPGPALTPADPAFGAIKVKLPQATKGGVVAVFVDYADSWPDFQGHSYYNVAMLEFEPGENAMKVQVEPGHYKFWFIASTKNKDYGAHFVGGTAGPDGAKKFVVKADQTTTVTAESDFLATHLDEDFGAPGSEEWVGDVVVGETITLDPGEYAPKTSFSYVIGDWNEPFTGPKGSYTIRPEDVGNEIRGYYYAFKKGYVFMEPENPLEIPATVPAAAAEFTDTPYPEIVSLVTDFGPWGLSADIGDWDPRATLSYQWYADGVAVPGATTANFWITAEYSGSEITLAVTGSRPGFVTVTRVSETGFQLEF